VPAPYLHSAVRRLWTVHLLSPSTFLSPGTALWTEICATAYLLNRTRSREAITLAQTGHRGTGEQQHEQSGPTSTAHRSCPSSRCLYAEPDCALQHRRCASCPSSSRPCVNRCIPTLAAADSRSMMETGESKPHHDSHPIASYDQWSNSPNCPLT
jgi:hypothetical protein